MDSLHRLLWIQNQSWFFPFKESLKRFLTGSLQELPYHLDKMCEEFPELRERLEFPLRVPELPFPFKFIVYGAEDYPQNFYRMEDPPLVLTLLGHACWRNQACLSVVGSRKPLLCSKSFIEDELGTFVEKENPVLVSGGARGVDQLVHGLALRKKKPTLVFLPAGLGEIYPADLKPWVRAVVAAGGGFLSEYPLGQKMEKGFFHHRNRLIAQMGVVTLIIQASDKSGTLMTGHLAAESGRPLWVIPGHPLQAEFTGSLKLLQAGATLVTGAQDLSLYWAVENPANFPDCVYLEGNLRTDNYI